MIIVDIAKITREGKKTLYHSLTQPELESLMEKHKVAAEAEKAKEGEKKKDEK